MRRRTALPCSHRPLTGTLLATVAMSVSVLGASPASAAVDTTDDASHDVVYLDGETFTAAPRLESADVTGTTVAAWPTAADPGHVDLAIRFRDLHRTGDGRFEQIRIKTSESRTFVLTISAAPEAWHGVHRLYDEDDASRARCRGLTHDYDWTGDDTLSVHVPIGCLGAAPTWVRTGQISEVAWHGRQYYDDAHLDGEVIGTAGYPWATLGPRVTVG